MDAEGAKLKAKSVGRRVHADFRRRIGDGQRRGNLSRDGSDVDDAPASLFSHSWRDGADQLKSRKGIDIRNVSKLGAGDLLDRVPGAISGIADQ